MRIPFSLGLVLTIAALAAARLQAQTAVSPKPEETVPASPPADTIPHDMVVINLGGLSTEFIHASYFHALDEHHALGLLAGTIYYPLGQGNVTGYATALAYRYYPGGRALWRFYVSPQVGWQGVALNEDTTSGGPMVAALIGWQWFPERSFAVGMGFGVRYIFGGRDEESAAIRKVLGFRPAVVVDLGYSW